MIRKMEVGDIASIYSIYSYYVEHSSAIFENRPKSRTAFRRMLESVLLAYPAFVAEHQGEILGYAYVHAAFEKECYAKCVESTIYFKEGNHRGLAVPLMEALEAACQKADFRWIIACITDNNQASIDFHTGLGYQLAGALPTCAMKFDQWYGVVWLTKDLWKGRNRA